MIDILSLIVTIIGIVIIPMLVFLFKQNSRIVVLETKIDYVEKIDKKLEVIFTKIDDLKDEIHSKSENYVTQNQCTSCK